MTFAAGTKLGTYEILGSLGAGGMGEVYRARDSKLKREVAIKVVSDRLARDVELALRLKNEALILASLNHPNIAAIYGLEECAGQQFFVMELVEGRTLAEIIASQTRLPWEVALKLCSQVASGLEAAHLKKITHRDVKPSNIRVTPEDLVKVLDFGLAKTIVSLQSDETRSRSTELLTPRTQEGSLVGTLAYMSPEQARGKSVDHRTDIWALGCVLYETITGKKAFHGETLSDTLAAILSQEPDWQAIPAGTPVSIRDFLQRCLQKDANLRFPVMGDVIAAMGNVRTGGLRITRRQVIGAAAISVTGLLGVALWPNLQRQWRILMLPKQKNIVVLPFRNIGGDTDQQAFSDGLTETLTTALNKHGELSVVPAIESRRLENPRQARKEFGVNLVVYGELQRRGADVRLTLILTDAERNRQIDAQTLDWPVARLFGLEDAVLVKLADLLNLVLTEAPQRQVSNVQGVHDAYLRGRGYLYRFDRPGNLDRALQSFEDAALRDSDFALAHVGKAETYSRMYRVLKDPLILESARAAAERALQLNPDLATPHVVLGGVESDLGEYQRAIHELKTAQKQDPLDPAPSRELGLLYFRLNRFPEADAVYATAIRQRPGDWLTWRTVGSYYSDTQRLDKAEEYFRKVIDLTPDNPQGYGNLGGILLRQGRRQKEAEDVLLRAVKINPTTIPLSNLAYLYMQQRRYKDAVKVMEQAAALAPQQSPKEFRIYGNLGDAYWLAGDIGKARQGWHRAAETVRGQVSDKPGQELLWAYLAKFEAKTGESSAALVHIERALKPPANSEAVHYQAGLVFALLGRTKDALEQLRAAIKLKYPTEEIQQAPELETLRGDPGYKLLFASPQAKP